ncbi:MAG: DinB family protein [Caldimonas sp.]
MITPDHGRLMAQYNQWMNQRLYAVCAGISNADLRADRGAFFKSIYATLNHIVYGDLSFLSRFTGDPVEVPALGTDLCAGFPELRSVREALDARLVAWAQALTPSWLQESLTYTSKIDGRTRTAQKWVLVTHLFNHQTHHRGQVTTLLSQMGLDVGSTDIPFMAQFEPG